MLSVRPSSDTSPNAPCSMCQFHVPSQSPVVGGALKLHGQPKSQLHATRTVPFSFQSAIYAPFVSAWNERRDRDGRTSGPAGLALLGAPALLVVDGVLDDLAADLLFTDHDVDRLADVAEVLANLRKPERLPVQVGRLDRLCDETNLFAVHRDDSARGLVAPALEHHAREAKLRRILVPGERLLALEVALLEIDRPAQAALVR